MIVSLKKRPVVVVGQGYVGLPLAMEAVSAGYHVVGIDTDERRAEFIRSGTSPVSDVSSSQLQAGLQSGRYSIQSNYHGLDAFSVAVISVPTPLRDSTPDLSFIEKAGHSLSKIISTESLVILESTTYPGTTEELLAPILSNGSGLEASQDFYLGYSPERIDPGNTTWTLKNTPKVTSGMGEISLQKVNAFYQSLGITVVPVSGTREAELAKLLENTFRHVNIALVNELARFSAQLGLNIWESIDAASTKPFGFMRFTPGPGVGGHCLPIDPSYLSWVIKKKTGSQFKFVELANAINSNMPYFVLERVREELNSRKLTISGSRVLLGGISYKPNTGDTRESPSVIIGNLLIELGAEVYGLDSFVVESDWPPRILKHTATGEKYDIGISLTPHDNDDSSDLLEACEIVLDTRNSLTGPHVRHL